MEAHVPVRTRISAELRPVVPPPTRRRSARAAVSFEAGVLADGAHGSLCRIVDLSRHGARIQTFSDLRTGDVVLLTLPGDLTRATRIVWFRDYEAGCQFDAPLSEEAFARLTDDHARADVPTVIDAGVLPDPAP